MQKKRFPLTLNDDIIIVVIVRFITHPKSVNVTRDSVLFWLLLLFALSTKFVIVHKYLIASQSTVISIENPAYYTRWIA